MDAVCFVVSTRDVIFNHSCRDTLQEIGSFPTQKRSSENMTSIEAGVFWHILVHVEGRHSPRRKHISIKIGWNGLGFLQRGARYVGKWTLIPDVESVASEEANN